MARLDIAELVAQETRHASATAPAAISVRATGIGSPIWVLADELRLSQVLRNLLSNAVRHTPEGTVEVAVEAESGKASVVVSDTGEGIPEADLPYVFERFYRADVARTSSTGGAGLGLAIARRIIEDHGGEVFAASRAGGGAQVGFRIPLAP
jgi:signal transduction histidine kinase